MKHRAILFALLTVLIILTACGSEDETDTLLKNVYSETPLISPDDGYLWSSFIGEDGGAVWFLCEEASGSGFIEISDGGKRGVGLPVLDGFEDNGYVINAAARLNGCILFAGNGTSDDGVREVFLTYYFDDGRVETLHHIEKFFSSNIPMVTDIAADAEGRVYIIYQDELVVISDGSGAVISLPSDAGSLGAYEGEVYVIRRGGRICPVGEGELLDPLGELTTPTAANGIVNLIPGEKMLAWDNHLVYEVKDGKKPAFEPVMSFSNSGVAGNPQEIYRLSDGDLLIAYVDGQDTYFSRFSKAEDIDISDRTIIRLATLGSDQRLNSRVQRYNRKHPELFISVRDYSVYNTSADPDGGSSRFYNDISGGRYKPDIVCGYMLDKSFTSLVGYYADLTPFADAELPGLFGCIRRSYSADGKLFALPDECAVYANVAKRASLGGKASLTVGEFLDLLENLPDGVRFTAANTGQNAQFMLGRGFAAFVDDELDAGLLRRFLTYIIEMPTKPLAESAEVYMSGEVISYPVYLDRLAAIGSCFYWFEADEALLFGNPKCGDVEGNGAKMSEYASAYAIMEDSDKKQAAFGFIKAIYDEPTSGLPRTHGEWEKMTAEVRDKHLIVFGSSSAGFLDELPTAYSGDWREIKQNGREFDMVYDFLENGGVPLVTLSDDKKLSAIIAEEVSEYLAGVRSADECIEIAADRVKIYLSEKE